MNPCRPEPLSGKIVTIQVEQAVFRILDSTGTVLTVAARTNTQETRHTERRSNPGR